jgi:prenyltransferase beta subunit
MAFKFRREEVTAILKACEGHTFGGAKPTCLFKLTQHLTLSAKEFRELVRYLKSVAMAGIHNGVVGCGLAYRQYLKSTYCAMQALDICNTIKMSAIQAP